MSYGFPNQTERLINLGGASYFRQRMRSLTDQNHGRASDHVDLPDVPPCRVQAFLHLIFVE